VVVRPEHARLVADAKKATLTGMLDNVVYFGTDTHYHVSLKGGVKSLPGTRITAQAKRNSRQIPRWAWYSKNMPRKS
jgi:hypothetical protein